LKLQAHSHSLESLKTMETPLPRLSISLLLCAATSLSLLAGNRALAQLPPAPSGLLLERLSSPLGIEHPTPALSWIMNHPEPDAYQTAYQIRVATSRATLEQDHVEVWDSGKVASSESSNARYAGPDLEANSVYFWRVRIWDQHDQPSPFSEPQMFVTAMRGSWPATPIWAAPASDEADSANFVFLRREFELPGKEIAHAIVHVTAVSPEPASQYVYRLYLNGQFIGCGPERGFNGITRYNTYHVSEHLIPGATNAVGALNYTAAEKKFLFLMVIRFADGTTQCIASDGTWDALDGDEIYVDGGNAGHGSYHYAPREFIQAMKYPVGWKVGGWNATGWSPAVETDPIDNLKASAQHNENQSIILPVRVTERAPGHYFVDFGRSLLGGFRLHKIMGEAGREVEIRLGQELLGPQTVRYAKRTGNTYQEVWTLRDGPQTLSNWGYRSYRYAEVLGAPAGLEPGQFQALALRQPFDPSDSHFESSDFVLNDVWDMLKYGIQATSLDVYVDTHSRERRNYEGDAYINQLSQYAVERQYAFPRYSVEYLFFRPTWPTEYKQQSVMMAWNDYLYTGNADSLEQHYAVLRKKTLDPFINADYLVEKPENAGSPWGRDLVDWPSVLRDGYRFSTINTVINAFNCRATELLGRIAGVLGKHEDAAHYAELAVHLRQAINQHLYDPGQGAFRDGQGIDHHALHASIMPVALGIARQENLAPAADHIFARGMQCNLYGAQFVLESLYAAGRGDLALQRMNALEGNSWGHMMYRLGATIATEAWDPSLKGNMAYSHGGWGSAPANNIVRGLFGIQPLEPGFATFQVKPQPGGLHWARIQTPTIKGAITVAFIQTAAAFDLTVTVPANTRATVYVPRLDQAHASVEVNGEPRAGRIEGGFVRIEGVGSGTHRFVRLRNPAR
jgi:alpha-L-rhamnosidase